MTLAPDDYLTLADWRRQVAALYANVRQLAGHDPVAAWESWRQTREQLYREHPQSPVPAARRATFRASHFPYDPALRFEAKVDPDPDAAANEARLPSSAGDALLFHRIGWLDVPFSAGSRRLALFWLAGYAGGLFLPFRDLTNGDETYAAGRYLLDGAKSADLGGDPVRGTLILDFNFAYQPSCAFDAQWGCPLAPPENWLDIAVQAGERLERR
jgi:uncharacterized protein (DUF1684 family)